MDYQVLSRIKYRNRGIWCGPRVVAVVFMRREISTNAQNTALDTINHSNPDPNPDSASTHINFVQKKSGFFSKTGFFFGKKLVDHTKSHKIKYFPISMLFCDQLTNPQPNQSNHPKPKLFNHVFVNPQPTQPTPPRLTN